MKIIIGRSIFIAVCFSRRIGINVDLGLQPNLSLVCAARNLLALRKSVISKRSEESKPFLSYIGFSQLSLVPAARNIICSKRAAIYNDILKIKCASIHKITLYCFRMISLPKNCREYYQRWNHILIYKSPEFYQNL